MVVVRFGYCPPNPGWKTKNYGPSFTNIENAIKYAQGHEHLRNDIWISYNKRAYRKIDFYDLCNLIN